jgi:hypothetical protein
MRRLPLVSLLFIPVICFLGCPGLCLSLLFLGAMIPVTISPNQLADAQTDCEYEATLQVSGNDTPVSEISVIAGSFPPGLRLSHKSGQNTAIIHGRPEIPGTYSFTIRANCLAKMVSGQMGEQRCTLLVK